MKRQARPLKRAWYGIAILVVACVVAAGSWRRQQLRALSDLPRAWQARGITLKLIDARHGPLTTTVREATLTFASRDIDARAEHIVLRPSLFSGPSVQLRRVQFQLRGDPSQLFSQLLSLARFRDPALHMEQIDVEYHERTLGRLEITNVRLEPSEDGVIVHGDRATLGSRTWEHPVLFVHQRNQMIEVALGEISMSASKTRLNFYPARGGFAEWLLAIRHQPAPELLRQLGYHAGSAFDGARVGGTVALVVPSDPAQPSRGHLQLVVDGWPKPPWDESTHLLGNTASFSARINPSPGRDSWDLVDAELRLSIFDLYGTARIRFDDEPRLALDVQGSRRCEQLAANLPPESHYTAQVKQYIAADHGTATSSIETHSDRRTELSELHLQLVAASSDLTSAHAAWRLSAACGIAEMDTGSFSDLKLPPPSPRKPKPPGAGLSLLH